MLYTPAPVYRPNSWNITPFSPEAMGITGGYTASTVTTASATWPSANLGIFYPFALNKPAIAYQFYVSNGAAVSGNLDVAIYDDAGTRLVRMGSTAQAGTSGLQFLDITDTPLAAFKRYYLGMALDNATGTTLRRGPGTGMLRAAGLVQMASAFSSGMVASATFATLTNNYCPDFGVALRSDF